jgi:hypothetical protein
MMRGLARPDLARQPNAFIIPGAADINLRRRPIPGSAPNQTEGVTSVSALPDQPSHPWLSEHTQ